MCSYKIDSDNRIRITAKLNGSTVEFFFDTGCTFVTIWDSTPGRIGLLVDKETFVPASPGGVPLHLTNNVRLELSPGDVCELRLAVGSDMPVSPGCDGLLGLSAIEKYIWLIQGSHERLVLLGKIPAHVHSWTRVERHPQKNLLALKTPRPIFAGESYIGVDTGAQSGLILFPEMWKAWHQKNAALPLTLDAHLMPGHDGVAVTEVGWAKEIDIGGIVLRDVFVSQANEGEINSHPAGTVAKLGMAAVRRLDLLLELASDTIYLRQVTSPQAPHTYNRLGAVFVQGDGCTGEYRSHVTPLGPAARLGIQADDVLLKIDDLEIAQKPKNVVVGSFWKRPAGTKYRLLVRRGDRELAINVELEDFLEK